MTAKQVNIACLAVSLSLAAWSDLYPRPYGACINVLMTVPWLCLLAVIAFRKHRFAFLGILLFFPTLLLGYRAFHDIQVLAWTRASLFAFPLTAIYFALVCLSDKEMRRNNWGWLLALFPLFLGMYGYGAVLEVNMLLDSAVPQHFTPAVIQRSSLGGRKGTTYYLELGPWGNRTQAKNVITWDLFRSMRGRPVACVDVGPGRLGIPWYRIGPCA